MVPWESLRPVRAPLPSQERQSKAGRKAIDPLVWLRLFRLQPRYHRKPAAVADPAHERASCRRCLGLSGGGAPPDGTTLDGLAPRLRPANRLDGRESFAALLRHSRDANQPLQQGTSLADGLEPPHTRAQNEPAARWTQKQNQRDAALKLMATLRSRLPSPLPPDRSLGARRLSLRCCVRP